MALKKKPPLLPHDIDLDAAKAPPGAASPQPFIHEAAAPSPSAQESTKAGSLKEKAVNMTLYLLPHDHRRLRQIAAAEDTSVQTLLMDAIDLLLAQRGTGPLTRWETRRRLR